MTEVEELRAEVERLKRDCPLAAELFRKTGMSQTGHDFRCSGCAVEHARQIREVLLRLAPHVAVQSRNPMVAPENRADLLNIEPDMLRVLLATKYLEGER